MVNETCVDSTWTQGNDVDTLLSVLGPKGFTKAQYKCFTGGINGHVWYWLECSGGRYIKNGAFTALEHFWQKGMGEVDNRFDVDGYRLLFRNSIFACH